MTRIRFVSPRHVDCIIHFDVVSEDGKKWGVRYSFIENDWFAAGEFDTWVNLHIGHDVDCRSNVATARNNNVTDGWSTLCMYILLGSTAHIASRT